MRQFRMLAEGVLLFFLILGALSLGCGGGAAVGSAVSVNLTPAAISLNRGATAQISAQALTSDNVAVGIPDLSFSSDNPAGITVSTTGMICAGQWDANFINCRTTDSSNKSLPLVTTNNPAHVSATFTVSGQPKSSSAVVVTDHERIDSVQVCSFDAVSKTATCPAPTGAACVSQNAPSPANTAQFIAQAFSNDPNVCGAAPCQLPDETIGAVDWSVSPPQVGSFIPTSSATTAAGVPVTVTANTPGQGTIIASIGPSDSAQSGTATYTTCGVASIHVHQQNMMPTPPDTAISFSAGVGSTVNLVADVLDSNNVSLSNTVGLALNWFSSQPALASVSVGTVGTIAPGFAQITAACLPPACNFGFNPPRPVFSDDLVTADVTGTPDSTVLVTTSTGPTCTANTACSNSDLIVPIDTVTNKAGTAFTLPAGLQVNSMVMTPQGDPAFLGTNCSGTGVTGPSGAACSGLLRFDPTVATVAAPTPTVTGTVLATDGSRVVLANPPPCFPPAPGCTSPVAATQVLIVRTAGSVIEKTLPIPNATAAAFAIDGSKIYIVAGHQLFIYSTTLGQLTTGLNGTARPLSAGLVPQDVDQEVAFFATGAMAYVADSAGDDLIATCDDAIHSTVSVLSPPATHIAAIPNAGLFPTGTSIPAMVDADSPYIDEVDVDASSTSGCFPMFTNSVTHNQFHVSGGAVLSSFTAKQLIVTPDSKLAIILTSDQGILVYDLTSKTAMPPLALSGGAKPISGVVTPDGATLYVGADDKAVQAVHRVDLTKTPPVDAQSIAVNLCPSVSGGCTPDFLVIRPAATAVTLTSLAVTAPGNSSPTSPTLRVGAMQQFKATGTFSDMTTRDMTNFVTWISSNTNVAVIGPTTSGTQPITTPGLAQALAIGTTSITAFSGGASGSITLTVQ